MQRRIIELEDAVLCWEKWHEWQASHWHDGEGVVSGLQQRQQQQQRHHQQLVMQPTSITIDYSKWDKLSCYSDSEDADVYEEDDAWAAEEPEEDEDDNVHYQFAEHQADEDEDDYGWSDEGEAEEAWRLEASAGLEATKAASTKFAATDIEKPQTEKRASEGEEKQVLGADSMESPTPEEEEEEEAGGCNVEGVTMVDAIESALGSDLASNKAIVLREMEAAGHKIIQAQAWLEENAARRDFSELTQRQKQQIETYLEMATQLTEKEYSKEGSTALISIIRKWQSEALQHLQALMAEEKEKG